MLRQAVWASPAVDTLLGKEARRSHRQGDRGLDRRKPQHHQGACQEAGGATVFSLGRPGSRGTLHDQVAAGLALMLMYEPEIVDLEAD